MLSGAHHWLINIGVSGSRNGQKSPKISLLTPNFSSILCSCRLVDDIKMAKCFRNHYTTFINYRLAMANMSSARAAGFPSNKTDYVHPQRRYLFLELVLA